MAFFHAEIDFEQELGVSFDRDLKVTRVAQGGQGQLKGIQAGFRLLSVEGVSVTNVVDFQLEKRRCEFDGRSKCELEFKMKEKCSCTMDLSRSIGVSFTKDMVVTRVQPHGQGALGGITLGSRILAVGGQGVGAPVKDVTSFKAALTLCKTRNISIVSFIYEKAAGRDADAERVLVPPSPPLLATQQELPLSSSVTSGNGAFDQKAQQKEVVRLFLESLGLGNYYQVLVNDLGADNIEDCCNPAVLHPSDLEDSPLAMNHNEAKRFVAATAGARRAKSFLVEEGFESYIPNFIRFGVFRIEQLVELSDDDLESPSIGMRPLQVRKYRIAVERFQETAERDARQASDTVQEVWHQSSSDADNTEARARRRRTSVAGAAITIHVKTFSGQTVAVPGNRGRDSVEEVKARVAVEVGSKPEMLKLFHKGAALLDDSAKLVEIGIRDGSMLHMILKPSRKHSWRPLALQQRKDNDEQTFNHLHPHSSNDMASVPEEQSKDSPPGQAGGGVKDDRLWNIDWTMLELEAKPFAQGGGGMVFAGHMMANKIAAKIIHSVVSTGIDASSLSLSKAKRAEFDAEVAVLAKLSHPNVLPFYGISDDPKGGLYMISEFCSGGDLDSYMMKANFLVSGEFSRVCLEIMSGITYLHSRNICHRDLKPANVLLQDQSARPKVKIGDFGLARTEQYLDAKATRTVGTPVFMAPELFAFDDDNEDEVDEERGIDQIENEGHSEALEVAILQRLRQTDMKAVDLYALGIILWQLWFRLRPWDKKSLHSIVRLVSKGKRPPLSPKSSLYTGSAPIPPPAPDSLRNCIEQLWSHNPDARPNVEAVFRTFKAEVAPQILAIESGSSSNVNAEGAGNDNIAGSEESIDNVLPYGGDLSAAMRAQDRSAIRAIMKHRQKNNTSGYQPPKLGIQPEIVSALATTTSNQDDGAAREGSAHMSTVAVAELVRGTANRRLSVAQVREC